MKHYGSNGTALCRVFMRNGRSYKVDSTTNPKEVTCEACRRKMQAQFEQNARDTNSPFML